MKDFLQCMLLHSVIAQYHKLLILLVNNSYTAKVKRSQEGNL